MFSATGYIVIETVVVRGQIVGFGNDPPDPRRVYTHAVRFYYSTNFSRIQYYNIPSDRGFRPPEAYNFA
jgi:hypothetical protein